MKKLCSLFLAGAALALAGCASAPMHGEAPMVRAMPVAAPATAGKTEVLWLGQATTPNHHAGRQGDRHRSLAHHEPEDAGRLQAAGSARQGGPDPRHPRALRPLRRRSGAGEDEQRADLQRRRHGPGDRHARHRAAALAPRFGKSGTIQPFGPNGVKITAVHAEHSSELVWKNPATGKDETHFGGEPVGYILEMENGFRLWHMGDTGLFGDMRLIGELYKPDLVMIPIGGHFTMGPNEAAIAVRDFIRPKYVIPIHYGTFPALRGTRPSSRTTSAAAHPPCRSCRSSRDRRSTSRVLQLTCRPRAARGWRRR